MKQFVIVSVKEVALKYPTADKLEAGEEKVDECTSKHANVYTVDVAMSIGEASHDPWESFSGRCSNSSSVCCGLPFFGVT